MTPRPLDDDPVIEEIVEALKASEERLSDLAFDRLREAVADGVQKVPPEQKRLEQARRAVARAVQALAPRTDPGDGP